MKINKKKYSLFLSGLLIPIFLFTISCEDPTGGEDNEPSLPSPNMVYMWASGTTTNGNMGGIAGAHRICQTDGAGGTFATPVSYHYAALYTSENDPRNYFGNNPPVQRPDGTVVSDNYADFWNPDFDTSNGVLKIDGTGWSNYWIGGVDSPSAHCNDWTSTDDPFGGNLGRINISDDARLGRASAYCNTNSQVLCVSF